MTRAELRAYARRYEQEHPSPPPSAELIGDVKRILAPAVNAVARQRRRRPAAA